MKRKYILKIIIILLIVPLLFFIGCTKNNQNSINTVDKEKTPAAESKKIKVGVLLPYTGVFADLAENNERGMRIAFEEAAAENNNYQIVMIKEDTEATPNVGLQKAKKLVLSDKVDLIIGIVSSSVAYAVKDFVDQQKIPVIITVSEARELTREKGSPYIFRTFLAAGQADYPFGKYANENLGYKTAVIMGPDYAAGHEKADAFIQGFTEAGGQIVQEIYPPLGSSDYGPYLSQLKQADFVWTFLGGGNDAIKFVKQYEEYGIKAKMPLLFSGGGVDESILPSIGDAAIGIVSVSNYSALLETPENKELVKATTNKYNIVPNQFLNAGYVAAKTALSAIDKLEGNIEEKDKFLKALKSVEFPAPQGLFRFHPESQNGIFDAYIRRVEKLSDGTLGNVVIDKIPNVTDRW